MVVLLFIPSLGPAYLARLYPESLWQVLFTYPYVPAIKAGVLFLPLLLPPLASWIACRSPVRVGSLLLLWSCLPLLLVGLYFWLESVPTDDTRLLILRLGFAFSFLLTLVETISLTLLLRSQEQAPRLVNQSDTLPFAQDQPNIRSDHNVGERRLEHIGTRRSLPSLVLPLILVLLCYLLIFLSLFFPYVDTWDDYDIGVTQTTGWQLSGEWLVYMGVLSVALFLLIYAIASLPFMPIQNHSLLFRSIALNHLFNLLGFLSSSLLLIPPLIFVGDLHGPFQRVDPAFGIPSAAFLLASIVSGLSLSRVLELRSGTRLAPAPTFPP